MTISKMLLSLLGILFVYTLKGIEIIDIDSEVNKGSKI